MACLRFPSICPIEAKTESPRPIDKMTAVAPSDVPPIAESAQRNVERPWTSFANDGQVCGWRWPRLTELPMPNYTHRGPQCQRDGTCEIAGGGKQYRRQAEGDDYVNWQ